MENGYRSFRSDEFLAFWGEVFVRHHLLGSAITFDEFVRDPHRSLERINRLDVLAEVEAEMFEIEPWEQETPRAAPRRSRERLRGWLTGMRALTRAET